MSTPAVVRYVECLSTLCVHDGRPVVANQNLILELLIKVRATLRPAAAIEPSLLGRMLSRRTCS